MKTKKPAAKKPAKKAITQAKKPSIQQIIDTVKNRLFATEKEVQALMEDERNIRVSTESGDERFWGLDIGDNMFIFTNDCLEFLPNRTWGRVGICYNNCTMDTAKTAELLKKSHEAYMDFYQSKMK